MRKSKIEKKEINFWCLCVLIRANLFETIARLRFVCFFKMVCLIAISMRWFHNEFEVSKHSRRFRILKCSQFEPNAESRMGPSNERPGSIVGIAYETCGSQVVWRTTNQAPRPREHFTFRMNSKILCRSSWWVAFSLSLSSGGEDGKLCNGFNCNFSPSQENKVAFKRSLLVRTQSNVRSTKG